MRLLPILSAVVLLLSIDSLRAQTAPRRDPVIGRWRWPNGDVKVVLADGTVTGDGLRGAWKRTTNATPPKYEFNWSDKWIDTVHLMDGGKELRGENNQKKRVVAQRLPDLATVPPATPPSIPQPPPPVSTLQPPLVVKPIGSQPTASTTPNVTADPVQPQTVWMDSGHKLTITKRSGDRFSGVVELGKVVREIRGTIKDNQLSWLAKDVRAASGGPGGDNVGTIAGDHIDFVWHYDNGTTGAYTLRRVESN